ncbi:MAG: AI-2E family transporter [Acidimicrobiia bacterium]
MNRRSESEASVPVPKMLDRAAAIVWRVGLLAIALVLVLGAAWRLRLVVLPVAIGLFVTALLAPPAHWLMRHGWRPLAATSAVYAGALAVLTVLVVVLVPRFVDEFGGVTGSVSTSIDDVRDWATSGPLHLSSDEVDRIAESAREQLGANQAQFVTGAVTGVRYVVEGVIVTFASLLLSFFFVKDGERLWSAILQTVPSVQRDRADRAGRRAWHGVRDYLRGMTLEALAEAAMKAIGLLVLGVPLVLPLAVITFLGGYIPLVGAVLAGALSASVALVTEGPGTALAVVALSLFIQNVASQLLDPLIMSRTTRLHPVVVLLAVTTGGVLAGVLGAVLAVPLVAATAGALDELRETRADDA